MMLNPYEKYAQNQVNTAPPEELTLMLYKGALKFITLGIRALEEKNMMEANSNIIRAQDIYFELMRTLDHNYEISNGLAKLYDYVINLLIQANVKKDKDLLLQASEMAKEFVSTWEEAIKIYRKNLGTQKTEMI